MALPHVVAVFESRRVAGTRRRSSSSRRALTVSVHEAPLSFRLPGDCRRCFILANDAKSGATLVEKRALSAHPIGKAMTIGAGGKVCCCCCPTSGCGMSVRAPAGYVRVSVLATVCALRVLFAVAPAPAPAPRYNGEDLLNVVKQLVVVKVQVQGLEVAKLVITVTHRCEVREGFRCFCCFFPPLFLTEECEHDS